MKILSIIKKSVILLSLLPIISIYAYDPSLMANRAPPARGGAYERPGERPGGEGARGYERGYQRGENNAGNEGQGNVIVAPQNPNNQGYYNNPAWPPPPPPQDYQNPDV